MDAATHTAKWIEDDAAFARELARGRRTELQVAIRLLPLGLPVRIDAIEFRESFSARGDRFVDQADIEVGDHLLEVKSRGIEFTSLDDYPYETAFVGSVRRWNARTKTPCAVVLFSEPTGECLIVPTVTQDEWAEVEAMDSDRGFVETSYAVHKRWLRPWSRLVQHVQKECL